MDPGVGLGLVVEIGECVRVSEGGRVLVGGAPMRLLRLNERAARYLDGRRLRVVDATSAQLADRLLASGVANPVLDELPPAELSAVTVVVPVRDRPGPLDLLLSGLAGRLRMIVVDDCSADPSAIARVADRHGAKLVALPANRGPATARNAGLAQVTTPLVVFIDSDVVVEPAALALLARHFHQPRVAAVAPRILGLAEPGGTNWIGRYEDARSSLDMGPVAALVHPRSAVGWVPAACLMARVAALGAGFTFADGQRVAEDVDLVWRLAAAGWQVRHEPAVTARHDHRAGLTAWLGRKAFYGTGATVLASRHDDAVAPAVFAPWSAGVAVALLAQRRWSLPAAAGILTAQSVRLARAGISPGVARHGLAANASQTSGLLLRHWWPLSLAGCLVSRRLRRAVLAAAVVDGMVDYRRCAPRLDPARFLLARRLDDLAYGTGLWAGALRGRTLRPLLPARPGQPGRPAKPGQPATR
ncbi:glycosyl transferase [Frankia sp. R43]|nr:glycosyl transferase [Frankia sp. R43]